MACTCLQQASAALQHKQQHTCDQHLPEHDSTHQTKRCRNENQRQGHDHTTVGQLRRSNRTTLHPAASQSSALPPESSCWHCSSAAAECVQATLAAAAPTPAADCPQGSTDNTTLAAALQPAAVTAAAAQPATLTPTLHAQQQTHSTNHCASRIQLTNYQPAQPAGKLQT
jgi:hypothetical protein